MHDHNTNFQRKKQIVSYQAIWGLDLILVALQLQLWTWICGFELESD